MEVSIDGDEEFSVSGNFTSEAIWPWSYGNSGRTLSILDVPELSSGPTWILGVLNPAIAIGQATVEINRDDHEDFLDFDVVKVIEAGQCILHPCEKTLSLTKVNGTTSWNDDSTNYGNLVARDVSATETRGPMPLGQGGRQTVSRVTLCWQAEEGDPNLIDFDGGVYSTDSSKRAFCPVEDYAYRIQTSLQGRYDEMFEVRVEDRHDPIYVNSYARDWYESKSGRFGTVGPRSTRNLSERAESIAVALTNWGLQTTNDTVEGEAYAEESYVRVRWQWITLPTFLELASLALLVLTIIYSRHKGVPLWKSSALALIYHAVDELPGEETFATERLSGMEVTAKMTSIQLVMSEDGLNSLSKRSGYRPVDQDG